MRVVITGASSGIGEALARHYASHDSILGLISRREAGAGASRNRLATRSTSPTSGACARARTSSRASARRTSSSPTPASASARGADELADVAKLRRVLDVNVTGLAATLAAFAPAMRAAGRGTLAGIASVAGFAASPETAPTAPRKPRHHLDGEPARRALRQRRFGGLRLPGYIDTPMTRVNRYRMPFLLPADDAARRIARAIAARRLCRDSVADGCGLGLAAN